MLGAFLLGVLTTRANQAGVMTGIAVSLGCMLLVKNFTSLAWTWYVLVGHRHLRERRLRATSLAFPAAGRAPEPAKR